MRILSLSFENINNLKGKQSISFESEPLRSAGIFAIVGPTGSGKSSILDVITLALFNRIPRFKGGISSTKIIDLGSIVTHHTSNAFAEISYEINSKKYHSKWSIEKNRNGKLKDYEMSIQVESGAYLDLKRSEVPGKNEAIIGLNYDQFIKSIILSQGQFAKFLKSDKNERGQLLENLTGTSIYRKIGQKAFFKFKETKRKIDDIELGLAEIKVLPEEEKDEITAKIVDLKTELPELEKEIARFSNGKQVKIEIQETKSKLTTTKQRQKLIHESKESFRSEYAKLEMHDQISPLRAELSNYKIAKSTIAACEKDISEYDAKSAEAAKNLQNAISGMGELTGQDVDSSNFKAVMSSFEKEVNTLDNELVFLKNNGQKVRERLNEKLTKYPTEFSDRMPPTEMITNLEKDKAKLLFSIQSSSFNEDSDILVERKILNAEKESLTYLKQVQEKSNAVEKLRVESDKAIQSVVELKKNIVKDQANSLNEISKQKLQKQLLESLVIQKENAIKIASLEELRGDLSDGQPCPLCGAVHHPYSEHIPNVKTKELDQQILKTKNDIQTTELNLKRITEQLTKNQTNVVSQEKLITQQKADQSALEIEISALRKIDALRGLDFAKVQDTIAELLERIKNKEVALLSLETLKINLEIKNICEELQTVISSYKLANTNRQAKFSGLDVSKTCNDLQDQFSQSATIIATNKEAISLKKKEENAARKMLVEVEALLIPQMQTLGFESINSMSENLVEESVFIKLKKQKEDLMKEETAVTALLLSLETQLTSKEKEDKFQKDLLDDLMQNLRSKEEKRDALNKQIGELVSILNMDKQSIDRRKEKQKSQEVLLKELEKWSLVNNLIGDASGNKFANFAQGLTLRNLLVLTNKRLKHLSERYILDKPSPGGELRVIDQYQGNTERAISTLSGGETFIISLALALSLSDMASRNVSLDSLFIDEGFGTLDQETLEVALDTLEKLQTESQKMVGVISHVAALKERINVQIKLQKNAQGFSSLIVES